MQESQPLEQKKDESLEKLFNQIKVEFAEDKSVTFKIETGEYDTGLLHVSFEKQIGENGVDRGIRENVVRRINKIVESNQFEARMRGFGSWGISIRIDPKFIDGKINWRRWPPNYKAFSESSQNLLDEVALTYPELSKIIDEGHSHDEYGRFNHFLRMAPLDQKERKVVEREMSVAFR
jgi:hypothetical protein